MADLYVGETTKPFVYKGKTYKVGDIVSLSPCDTLNFLDEYKKQNPKGVTNGDLTQAVKDCIGSIFAYDAKLLGPTVSAFVESNQNTLGGDSAVKQGAPNYDNNGKVSVQEEKKMEDNPPPNEEKKQPTEGEKHPTLSTETPQKETNAGDPVDIFSGAFYLSETDLVIPNTIMPLAFTRYYRSGMIEGFGSLGWNWDHNYNLYLRELNTGDIALWRNLREEIFKFDGTAFEPQRGVFEKLERIAGLAQIYEIYAEGGTTIRFERPLGWINGERIPILWIQDRSGNKLSFSYGAEDKLIEVRDDDDRFFKFDYDNCGLLVAVTDNAGRRFEYEHDEQTMQLIRVKSPATTDHPKGIQRIYHYESPWLYPELRHNIIRVEDANGNVYLENKYEQDPSDWSYARVTEQLYGSYLYQFRYTQLQYVPANPVYINIPALRVEVMNPDFSLETYTFNYRGDLLDRRYRLSKDKSYRVVVYQYEFDEQGNSSKIIRPDGSEEINTYDFANADPRMRGNLLQKELTAAAGFPSPSRIVWRGKYEPVFQQIKEEINESGAITTYKYDFDISPGAPNNVGNLLEVIYPDATLTDGTTQSAVIKYEYNNKGQLVKTILPDGVVNIQEYGVVGDEKSRLIKKISDFNGLQIVEKLKYDIFGFNHIVEDGNGNITQNIFNALGLVEKTILPPVNGHTAEHIFHYDSDKKLISQERPKGSFNLIGAGNHLIDTFERDVLGYPTKAILSNNSSESRVTKMCNDYRGKPTEIINPDGSKTIVVIDERNLPISETVVGIDGKKISTQKTYDRSGKLTQETDSFGLTTKYEYDGFSRISKIILPNQTEIRRRWLENDLLASEEVVGDDGTGLIRQLSYKSFTYDEKSRKISESLKSFENDPTIFVSLTTTFFYDELDRVVKTINHRGGVSNISYDGLGRVIIKTDPMGNEEYFAYDNNGNILKTESHHKEPNGTTSILVKNYKYDARNRRVELIESDGAKIISEYDDRNLLIKQTDYLGIIKETIYNSFNDKIQEIKDVGGLNIINQWQLDNMSRMVKYIDPMGQESFYDFDSLGRNVKTSYPNGFSSTKTYNENNQIISEQLGSGVIFDYQYDNASRLTKIINRVSPAPIIQIQDHLFEYDGQDRVIKAQIGSDIISREYDSLGRLLLENALGATLQCKYNDTGDVEKKWPDGRTEVLRHNLNGVITKIEQVAIGNLGTSNAIIASFKLSGSNFLSETLLSNGVSIKNTFDERKRLIDISVEGIAGVIENIKYYYNTANNRQLEAILGTNPKISYFEFDNKYRLVNTKNGFSMPFSNVRTQTEHNNVINNAKIAASTAVHREEFSYNNSDARLKYSETGELIKNYSYFSGHQVQSDGTNTYLNHTDGTLKSDSLFTYDVDALGRIVAIKKGASTITSIKYDAFNRPVEIKEEGKPVKTFNYFGGFIEQENENGIPSRQITIQPVTGVPIAYHINETRVFTLFDGRFNLIGLIDNDGNIIENYQYKSFGKPQVLDQIGTALVVSAFGVEPIFGGQRYLDVTGLYLSKRRLMNPSNGIFLSSDPSGYLDSSSLYVYTGQDPINNIDPNGDVAPIVAVFVIGGAILGAGYSVYDAYHHPEKYAGLSGVWKPLASTFGGAAIGGTAIVAGESVLAAGGVGAFATEGTSVALTGAQTFGLYGTSNAVSFGIGRFGFNKLFPEYISPVTPTTIGTDFLIGGVIGGVKVLLQPSIKNTTWTFQGDREAILNSGRIWGKTEGSVYGMNTPNFPTLRATGGGPSNLNSAAIFEFSGTNNIFRPHEINGPFSLIKNLLGQSKAGFGDIAFSEATQIGTRMVQGAEIPIYSLSGVRLLSGEFAGQSASMATARLLTRKSFDYASGVALTGLYLYNSDGQQLENHPNEKPKSSK